MTPQPCSFVYVTASSRDEALTLARTVVRERLAACANVLGGATSIYEWQGQLVEAEEAVLVLKVPSAGVAALTVRLVELHSYEVPCVVALPIERGHEPFLRWVAEQTGSPV